MDLKRLLSQLDLAADWVGLRYVEEITSYRWVRDGHPQANQRDMTAGIMVEVLVQGQFAYYATTRLDSAGVQLAAETAVKLARDAARYSVFQFTTAARPANTGSYRSAFSQAEESVSPAALNQLLIRATERLKVSDKIVSSNAMAQIVRSEQQFVSSNGSDIEQQFLMVSADYSALAQHGPIVQKRSDSGMLAKSWQIGMEVFNEEAVLQRCEQVGAEAVELLSAEECPTETLDLLLAPDQMMLQIHESVGHPLELDRILGDERNYAGWSFVRLGDFGKLQYGSELMNITFDPGVEHQLASYNFDDGGARAEREYIIRQGILQRGLGGVESQLRSGVAGVANFRASSWNRAPIDRMANLNLEPGDSSLEDLIGSVEKGVYMQSNRSWSIDDYRNKFQFGCEYATLIEHGKLTRTLKNPNYRGISSSFWKSLKGVGDRSTLQVFGTPNCGKGEPNQSIRVGHASPPCLFADVEVFGGEN
ncbi:MAG: TldD/PmbA family protein [Gammaproteobacteria bacterium]|nr:TldD/PmbA family protein [Gammaproteobacteria bacterium]